MQYLFFLDGRFQSGNETTFKVSDLQPRTNYTCSSQVFYNKRLLTSQNKTIETDFEGEYIAYICMLNFFSFYSLMILMILWEKAMAPHSSTLAWKIPWTEEPGKLQYMASLRVRQDWATSLSLFTFMHWRRKWLPTPVFLAWRIPGTGSLMGCHLWGRTELDTIEAT